MSVSMIDGHIDPDTNRMTDKESYSPLQYVDEDYNPIEITSKPTDKEIIQALECCKTPVGSGSCNDCPFDYQRKKRLTSTDKSCTTLMFDYALDLINRQQAEIERLKELIDVRHKVFETKCEELETAKAEAIKECLGWVLSLFPEDKNFTTISRFTVNQKIKEMVGEDK